MITGTWAWPRAVRVRTAPGTPSAADR